MVAVAMRSESRSGQALVHELLLDKTHPPLEGASGFEVSSEESVRKACGGHHSPCWACLSAGRRRGRTVSSLSLAGSAAGTPSLFLGGASDIITLPVMVSVTQG